MLCPPGSKLGPARDFVDYITWAEAPTPRGSARWELFLRTVLMALPLHNSSHTNGGDASLVRTRTRPSGDRSASGEDVELHHLSPTLGGNDAPGTRASVERDERGFRRFVRRFKGEGRFVPSYSSSLYAVATCSSMSIQSSLFDLNTRVLIDRPRRPDVVLNVLLILLPISWVGHFKHWTPGLEFTCEARKSVHLAELKF